MHLRAVDRLLLDVVKLVEPAWTLALGPEPEAGALKQGHGLDSLQDRLSVLFDGAGRIELARRDGRMVVSVAVPRVKETVPTARVAG